VAQENLHARMADILLSLLPADGAPVGNTALRRQIEARLATEGLTATEDDYRQAQAALLARGVVAKGQGRGGSVRRVPPVDDGFALEAPQPAPAAAMPTRPAAARSVAVARAPTAAEGAQIIAYRHPDRRLNNPDVGMVTPASDPDAGKTRWACDPHLDPALQFDPPRARIETLIDDALASGDAEHMRAALQALRREQAPYLAWTGKAERTQFDVDLVSLHVHERIDPLSIVAAARNDAGRAGPATRRPSPAVQPGLFDAPFENLPLRDAIDFYRHERGWANRLITGDSLLVMNSLLQKESMAGRVQMIYIDPPYGIKYGSNFQPFVGKRDVKDRSDADLTQEPETIKAFRDTWELGIHSYLTYLRDRLLLAKELLHESGSVFVQISDENLHLTRNILDEIFGSENFCCIIAFRKTTGANSPDARVNVLATTNDFIVWYAKDAKNLKYHQLYLQKDIAELRGYNQAEAPSGSIRKLSKDEIERPDLIPDGLRILQQENLTSTGHSDTLSRIFEYRNSDYSPASGNHWKTTSSGLENLARANRLIGRANTLNFKRYLKDFPVYPLTHVWQDISVGFGSDPKAYVVQTSSQVIERCLLMTTDPGDLVLDPTCGSGTTAFVAEKWGRRWITCDTLRVAVTLARQRLLTASYDYFELKYPHEGLRGGFIYKTVPHVTLKSIANNPEIDAIHERLHPAIEAALADLNAALRAAPPAPYRVAEGGRRGLDIDFAAPAGRTVTLPSGQAAPAGALLEWEVPFEFPDGWPASARGAFDAFHAARQAMQAAMDRSIAAHAEQETLYDQPAVARDRLRISGPFTVEAVPFPSVRALDEAAGPAEADASIARTGESGRQHQWRDELGKTGIRGKGGQVLRFADLETLADCAHLHASGYLDSGERVVVSFGPEHAALEQRQVASALNEAEKLRPSVSFVVFAAFAFDPEAAKDIDETRWPGVTLLKAQMNTDLLTEDLKKARASNQSFWLMGQPDVDLRRQPDGRYEVEVRGFDYFDVARGELVSGGKGKIALWLLDTDYDERSLIPRQVFFPMAGRGEGWEKLKKTIRAELDESRLAAFHGTVSLPFEPGENRRIAVKIVDDRGIESLKVLALS
jgi:adenine-specific DNA-methyltransferase